MDAALLRATQTGRLADVLRCLANGARATAADEDWCSALHWASSRGDACIAEALVRSGAPVNARSRFPGDVAARHGHVALASLLWDAAAARARWSGLRRAALTAWCLRRLDEAC